MKELGIDDSVDAPFLDALYQFAATPTATAPVPVALIEAFNKAQLRKKSRRNLRITAAALLGGIILIPGLAYAGVLPPPVARIVQRVLNVTRIPITLPANTTAEATAAASPVNSIGSDTLSTSAIPDLGTGTVPDLASILPTLLPDSTSVDAASTWGVASPLNPASSSDGSDTPVGDTQVNPLIDATLSPDATPTDTSSPDATPTDEPSPTDTSSPDATPTDEPSPTDTPLEILPTP